MKISYEVSDSIAIFTIDNGKVNVFTEEMHRQLYSHLTNFMDDDSIKVGILKGSNGKCFSAGDDLNEGDSYGEGDIWSLKVMTMPRTKPIIAAVNGWCLGQGFVYLSHLTDIRIAGEGARFGLPEISYGMGGGGGALRLSRHIPRVAANWIGLTGEKFSAEKAMQFHMINEVVADDAVFERALAVAKTIAQHPLVAIKTEIDCLQRCPELSEEESMHYSFEQYERQVALYKEEAGSKSGIEHIKNSGK